MTDDRQEAVDAESVTRAFYDIAQLLESGEDADLRVLRVIELLRTLVPYEACAVFDAQPGREPRLLTSPGTSPGDRAQLRGIVGALHARLIEAHAGGAESRPAPGTHLAVPLIGLDEVVGVLFVRGTDSAYDALHVRRLSIVAAKLAAYFSMLQSSALSAERSRQVEEARKSAEAANRVKDEFLAIVSHELRTPLNTILAWADILRSTVATERDRLRAFEAIERSVRAEAKLIDDLLDLSCIVSATLRLDLRAVEPAKVIRATVLALRSRAERKAIRLELALDESAMHLIADPQRLRQIVANLVANAIKFTPPGGRVEVHLERAGVLARIRVSDSGRGISPEALPQLFEPFRPVDGSSRRAHGGLGVGLALVKDLVVLHGGNVRAESLGKNAGATFTVELPLAPVILETPPRPATPKISDQDEHALIGVRVLLVDDDPDICEVLQFVLEGQGAIVTVAASAAEALAALERSMPNVLLSDIAMPGATGYDLMRKIVAREGAGAPPAAALSAYARRQDLPHAIASGFQMLLEKPIDPGALVAAVARLAGKKSGADARVRRAEGGLS
jgi:signal transduction histidine kinase/ActR/RegA family two-component response regulator